MRGLIPLERAPGLFDALDVDAWLLTDFRAQNPIAANVVLPRGHTTRRYFVIVPRTNVAKTKLLLHRIEADNFTNIVGEKRFYASRAEQDEGLKWLLAGVQRVAMEYSPKGALPYVSRVDAGTVDRVRALGIDVVSSEMLVQRLLSRLTPAGIASHRRAAAALHDIQEAAFSRIRRDVRARRKLTEWTLSKWMAAGLSARGMVFDAEPIVAINGNAGRPHYSPDATHDAPIGVGDLVLLDLWAKEKTPGAIYADITWVGFVGDRVPARYARAFATIAAARDAVVDHLRLKARPTGAELDGVCRGVIRQAGEGAAFIHRTGHSIDTDVHGSGVHIDGFETHDSRVVEPGSLFSVEPGLYYDDFGVRTEIDVLMTAGGPEVTTGTPQREIVPLFAERSEQKRASRKDAARA
ncbi:MAG: M24 family metallopeptidase [Deltaproteobacteria bacterium]|nr:M24 family metallopeptidase [Deltaproteobacteria bacterium]